MLLLSWRGAQAAFNETIHSWVSAVIKLVELLPTHPATSRLFAATLAAFDASEGTTGAAGADGGSGTAGSAGDGGESPQTPLPETGDGPSAGVIGGAVTGAAGVGVQSSQGAGAPVQKQQQRKQQQEGQGGEAAAPVQEGELAAGGQPEGLLVGHLTG